MKPTEKKSQTSDISLAEGNSPKKKAQASSEKATAKKTKAGKQIKVSVSPSDAEFLSLIADKLGISEAEVLRKGVKLMNLYANTYDQPETKLVLETADTKQDILVL